MARFGFRSNPSLNRGREGVISLFIPSKIEALELRFGGGGGGKKFPHFTLSPTRAESLLAG